MNKICTNISQSKILIELGIDIKTADMDYVPFANDSENYDCVVNVWNNEHEEGWIPAWSLSALLDVMPEGLIESYYTPNIQKENGKYSIAYGNEELLCIADNPIDACYEMILKLHEQKVL